MKENVMKKIALPAIAISFTLLTGCATITNGRFQQIMVRTQPPGASCVLSNDKGQWQVQSTPAAIQVHRSMNDLKVSCQKSGDRVTTDDVGSNMKKMIVGNAIFGGIVGAGIDSVDGAGFSYPNIIDVQLQPLDSLPAKKAGKSVTKHK